MTERTCPACGSTQLVKILYGMPTGEALEASQRGEIGLGGCVIMPYSPDRACRRCKQHFHRDIDLRVFEGGLASFYLEVGGGNGPFHHVYIDGERRLVRYASAPRRLKADLLEAEVSSELEQEPDVCFQESRWSEEQLDAFTHDLMLCEAAYWSDEYIRFGAGVEWLVGINVRKGTSLLRTRSRGRDAYPPKWSEFMRAMRRYVHKSIE